MPASGQGLAAKEPPRRLPPSLARLRPCIHRSPRRPSSHGAARTGLALSSLPRTSHRRSLDYAIAIFGTTEKGREGLGRRDGRTDEGRPDADCQRGFTCSAFFRKAARSGEARRPRPRPGDAAAVAASNSIVWVGRRTHIFGAIEGLSFSSKLSSNVHLRHPENAIPRMHRTREGGLYLRNLTAHHTAKYASSLPLSRPELPKVK